MAVQTPPIADDRVARRGRSRRHLVVMTIVHVCLWPLAAFWGVMTVMASDAGTSPAINLYINVNIGLPAVMIVAVIAAWVAWFLERYRLAQGLMWVPVGWAVLAFALMFTL